LRSNFEERNINHILAPLSSASSVGLAERVVQLVISLLRKWYIEAPPNRKRSWGLALAQIQLAINTRLIRNYGFVPAELKLGHIPRSKYPMPELPPHDIIDFNGPTTTLMEFEKGMEDRAAAREVALHNVAVANDVVEENDSTAKWTGVQVGDLVLVKDMQVIHSFDKKLEPRWSEPRRVLSITERGTSAMVENLAGTRQSNHIHLNHLKVFCPRRLRDDPSEANALFYQQSPELEFARQAVTHCLPPGCRGVFLV